MAERKPLYMSSEGFHVEMPITDSITLGGLTMGGNIVMATNLITGLGSPLIGTDAANMSYVQAVAQGLDPKPHVKGIGLAPIAALTGLAETVDTSVALDTAGDRVLLTAQTSGVQNGIWVVAATAWTRPTDFAAGFHAESTYVFASQGTLYADTGWVCTTNAPTDVVGTDALAFQEFSGAGQVTAGAGLSKTANTLSVKKGDGIEVTSNTASTNIDLGTNPGLELNGTSPNKKLMALVSAAGGVQIDGANGLGIKLNGTTLQTAAGGASVKGLPSLFEINGSAVSANVTTTNLGTLTAGASSNADALHTHSGMVPTYSKAVGNVYTASGAIVKTDPVYANGNNIVTKGDASVDAKARIIGLAAASISDTATGTIIQAGLGTGLLSGATYGTPYYLQNGGGIGTALPGAGYRVIMVGYAISAVDLMIRITDYGKQAA